MILENNSEKIVYLFNHSINVSENTHLLERFGLSRSQLYRTLKQRDARPFTSLRDIATRSGLTYTRFMSNLIDRVVHEIITYNYKLRKS